MEEKDIPVCTKEHPWTKGSAIHPDAVYVRSDYGGLSGGGDYEVYRCPNCGKTFYETQPD